VAIQRAVGPLLRARGYEIDVAGTGAQALRTFADRPPDLIVLDLGLPDIEGTEVCRRIRVESAVPIVVLSARGAESDKVNALDLGADDYVTKPFGPEELLARIRVALRRVQSADDSEKGLLKAGDLTIDYDRRRVLRGETEIRLTPKEFELLSLLARNHDRVLTHRIILKEMRRLSRARERVFRQRFFEPPELVVRNRGHHPLPAQRQRQRSNFAVAPRQGEDLPMRALESVERRDCRRQRCARLCPNPLFQIIHGLPHRSFRRRHLRLQAGHGGVFGFSDVRRVQYLNLQKGHDGSGRDRLGATHVG
jgi:two-component system KDP operon response regulator KdpE